MRIITISREFGSGGRELGKCLAEIMHFNYYDREIITSIAQNKGLDANYVETQLENHNWHSKTSNNSVSLLVEQKKVLENIAALGKDCIIVGRNADVILKAYQPLNLFVCADMETKLRRCMERSPEGEHLTEKELLRKIKQIDKMRSQTREILTNSPWGQSETYHLTINTNGWNMDELANAVSDFANRWFRRK